MSTARGLKVIKNNVNKTLNIYSVNVCGEAHQLAERVVRSPAAKRILVHFRHKIAPF